MSYVGVRARHISPSDQRVNRRHKAVLLRPQLFSWEQLICAGRLWPDECGRIERSANSETSENTIDRGFHRPNPLTYRGLSDRLGLSDTRNNVGKTVCATPLALSAIWSIFGRILKFGLGDGGLATRERLHYGRY
jgi:hypothetical protein